MATDQEILDLLICARDKIKDKSHWCTKSFARSKSRHRIDPTSPSAESFCAVGALRACVGVKGSVRNYSEDIPDLYMSAYRMINSISLQQSSEWSSIENVNDNVVYINSNVKGHAAVMKIYQIAIDELTQRVVDNGMEIIRNGADNNG
jgi:hypothetical protein